MARHCARALLPSLPAVVLVLALRALDGGADRTGPVAVAELAAYGLATLATTWAFERTLLREAAGYLRRRSAPAAPVAL